MNQILFGYTVAFLVLHMTDIAILWPVYDYDNYPKYEEYEVEHEISFSQARNAALYSEFNFAPVPGCQPCTPEEKTYCLGRNFVHDHCCCDKRYHEVVPFIPHTCYLGPILCKTVVESCPEYNRLRDCCCQKLVLEKWKPKSGGSTSCKMSWSLITHIISLFFIFYNT